ncbi:hypothetical protein Tco_1189690 [Tanacetum coccineum]
MGLWYPKDSGFELTAFSDADHVGCLDTRKSTSGGMHCNVFSRGRVRGVICKLCSSNVDDDTASRLWLQLQQNTVVLRLSVSHSNIMQPRTTLLNQAHPYSVSLHKGTVLPEDRFKYLVRRICMRCLTLAELEVLENETA